MPDRELEAAEARARRRVDVAIAAGVMQAPGRAGRELYQRRYHQLVNHAAIEAVRGRLRTWELDLLEEAADLHDRGQAQNSAPHHARADLLTGQAMVLEMVVDHLDAMADLLDCRPAGAPEVQDDVDQLVAAGAATMPMGPL